MLNLLKNILKKFVSLTTYIIVPCTCNLRKISNIFQKIPNFWLKTTFQILPKITRNENPPPFAGNSSPSNGNPLPFIETIFWPKWVSINGKLALLMLSSISLHVCKIEKMNLILNLTIR
jgi:hypothetical protein